MVRHKSIRSLDEVEIGYKLKLSYFVASIIPIIVMTYIYVAYIMPELNDVNGQIIALVVAVLLVMSIVLSLAGLVMTNRAAEESIGTLSGLTLRMDNLLDLTKTFRENFYVDVLLESIARSAQQVLNAEASSILLYDEYGNLRFEHVTGSVAEMIKGKVVSQGEGVTGWAAFEGKPIIVNNVKTDPRFMDKFDDDLGFDTRSIMCVPLVIDGRNIGVIEAINKEDGSFDEMDQKILMSLADHAALSIQRSKASEANHTDFIQVTEIMLAAMDFHVPEKKGHAKRVARYSAKIAKAMGLNDEDQKNIYFGALLHDIGLLKYNQDDYWGMKEFKMHPTLGYEMIRPISIWRNVAPFVLSHHERFDGAGYPRGIAGQDIPLGARIISVAEVFDTLVSSHSYKPTMPFSEALTEIRDNSGSQFDPNVVDIFAESFKKDDIIA